LDFSFSGVKTGVLNLLNTERQAGRSVNIAHIAASFQQSVGEVIVAKTLRAVALCGETKVVIAGGVAANSRLRAAMGDACRDKGLRLYCPSPILCTDNAAMVGAAAYFKYKERGADDLELDAFPNLAL
jgi:N6-L-threonylcarbamoyladenine synthase